MAEQEDATALMALCARAYKPASGDGDEDLELELAKATTDMLTMLAEVASVRMRVQRLQNPFFKERMLRFQGKERHEEPEVGNMAAPCVE